MKGVDEKLVLIASGIKRNLPSDFHDKAVNKNSISTIQDSNNVLALSEYVQKPHIKSTGVTDAYTLIRKDGKVYYTSSSKTEKELEIAIETPYFLPYETPSDEVISAFEKSSPTFMSVSTKWGTFRKILIPESSPKGKIYLAGLDIDIRQAEKKIHKRLWFCLGISSLFILALIPFIFIFRKSEKEQVEEFENLKDMLHQKSMHRTTRIEKKINELIDKK